MLSSIDRVRVPPDFLPPNGVDEGEACGRPGCAGIMAWPLVAGCTCHVFAPCLDCLSSPLTCTDCGETS